MKCSLNVFLLLAAIFFYGAGFAQTILLVRHAEKGFEVHAADFAFAA